MTNVLTPLTTPPMKPLPEESSPPPQFFATSMAFSVMTFQSSSSSSENSSPRAGRYASSPCSFARRFSTAAGTWLAAERMAAFTPGTMTHMAMANTPMTAISVKMRARGRRSRSICRSRGKTWRSMARMGTFSTKAMAPPSKKGARMPTSALTPHQRTFRCWMAT